MSEISAQSQKHQERAERLLVELFSDLGDFERVRGRRSKDTEYDLVLSSHAGGPSYKFDVKVRERITPQIADDLFTRLNESTAPKNVIRLVYAPVISDRVAEIARQHGMSYLDYAGNCRIVHRPLRLLVSRTGIPNTYAEERQSAVDPFSPKSSRIVRAMLHEPTRGWQVSELSEHPDVDVSLGLVSKVKGALLEGGYAFERDRLLYLKRPLDLLADWVKRYPPLEMAEREFYLRGDTRDVEAKVCHWGERSKIPHALARFSAAWRLAPEVRYTVGAIYLDAKGFGQQQLESLQKDCGAKEVASGANLVILTPFDRAVFVRSESKPEATTSPLQTYLDLQQMAGRGAEAAEAVFEKYLRKALEAATDQASRR